MFTWDLRKVALRLLLLVSEELDLANASTLGVIFMMFESTLW